MRTFKFLLSSLIVFILSSCHHSSEPLKIPVKYTQLNTMIAPWQKDNDLLPWKGQSHIMIINSIDDVYATQTERFIKENPNWLQVDFSSESIIAVRSILFDFNLWQYSAIIEFSKINKDYNFGGGMDYSKGDYILAQQDNYSSYPDSEDDDESQYRIYQTAIVTHKINPDAKVYFLWSTNIKATDVWD